MKFLKDLLKKYTEILPLEGEIRDEIVNFFSEKGIEISRENISLNKKGVRFDVPPTEKVFIFMHKKNLLHSLEEKFGVKAPKEMH